MKLYLLLSIIIISFSCNPTKNANLQETTYPSTDTKAEISGEKKEEMPKDVTTVKIPESYEQTESSMNSKEHHYVGNFKLTAAKATLKSALKVNEAFPLIIAPAFDMFMLTYKGQELVSYYAFPNPLEQHRTGTTIPEANATILLPALLEYEHKDIRIFICELGEYIDDWEAHINTFDTFKTNVRKAIILERYELDPKQIQAIIQQ